MKEALREDAWKQSELQVLEQVEALTDDELKAARIARIGFDVGYDAGRRDALAWVKVEDDEKPEPFLWVDVTYREYGGTLDVVIGEWTGKYWQNSSTDRNIDAIAWRHRPAPFQEGQDA